VFAPFLKLLHEGGWVLFPIFGVAIVVWHIGVGKLMQLWWLRRARTRACKLLMGSQGVSCTIRTGHSAFDAYVKRLSKPHTTPQQVDHAYNDLLIDIQPQFERGLSTIAAGVVIAPLLGLLGTISGMNEMFAVIGEFGFGNPTIMANGISMALQATLTGLSVAVVALLFLDNLNNSKMKLFSRLREDRDVMLRSVLANQPQTQSAPSKGGSMHPRYRMLHDDHQNPEINLAPFVDTIMILLIFFVVTANLYVETGVDVSRPKAQSATSAGQKAILIGVTREGTIHIYGRQTSLERLRTIVEQEVGKQPDISVVIISDREGAVGRTVEVVDQCTLAGVQKISLAAGRN
jgi:biopolymer transport protein ExbD